MKIALAYSGCHKRGGIERAMLECANFLCSRGHEVHLFALEVESNALSGGIKVHLITDSHIPYLSRLVMFPRQALEAIRQLDPPADIVGTFGMDSPPGGVMSVPSVHAKWLEISQLMRKDFWGRLKQRINPFHYMILAKEYDYFIHRKYKKLLVASENVKADLQRIYHVPPGDIVIIPNGFSPQDYNVRKNRELRNSMREKLGYNREHKVVLFVANELGRKGFIPLIRAIASLNDPSVYLLAVVKAKLNLYYYCLMKKLKVLNHVQFVGPSSDLVQYYAAADVFALPTQYEAWGLVIIEALACGLPVLTSRLAGASVALQEGRTGYLLDNPGDTGEIAVKLKWLLEKKHVSPPEISSSVAGFTWENILPRYEAVLRACIK